MVSGALTGRVAWRMAGIGVMAGVALLAARAAGLYAGAGLRLWYGRGGVRDGWGRE